ncbi:hypothetical protein QZQ24_05635 [Serratia marcescens]|uniref:hypothetical protein n=1 Tax=Serratia marcescens TaxID=615 RepID=UPI00276C8FBA|nr:hypothetical protein [Serratia marcescens]MDP8639013.1 hypothetical protein [Serratia marcescens]MDP8832490.1 hypothetical protein [Serratia marcescens]
MNTDLIVNTVLGLATAGLIGFVRSLFNELKELRRSIETIRADYQRRDDAMRTENSFFQLLQDVKRTVEHIDQKLDRKADKGNHHG